ncbi:MAG: germination protein YpeB [Clostridia bacterium]|nr:germination protein YpeB [Clostridia bacterium]
MKTSTLFDKYGRRLKKSFTAVISAFLFTALLSFAVFQSARAKEMTHSLQSGYSRAFLDLTSNVENIKYDLAKCMVTGDAREISRLAGEIFRESAAGGASLSQLPQGDVSLAGTSKFLNQVGDFTNNLSLKYMSGGEIDDAEYETLLSLRRYAEDLSATLAEMQTKLFSGELCFISDSDSSAAALSGGFEEMEQGFTDYPSLIYDGPFSDHIENKSPAYLEGASEITQSEAQKRINNMTGLSLSFSGEGGGSLPAYAFSGVCKSGAPVYAEITKRGGMLSWYLCDRAPETAVLSADEARNKAREYISLLGIPAMRDTYYEIQNGIAIVNFAAEEDGVILYPDLIKVRVALDTGEVIGCELHGYIMNHTARQVPPFSHAESEVLEKISPKTSVSSVNKCLIPTKSGGEIFCYEVRCSFEGQEFLIYLNSETLRQEDVLILLVSENGTLTI